MEKFKTRSVSKKGEHSEIRDGTTAEADVHNDDITAKKEVNY